MPEELLNAEVRQRLNIIFGGAEQNTVNTVGTTHATDTFQYATFAHGTAEAVVARGVPAGMVQAEAPYGRHETGAPILETPHGRHETGAPILETPEPVLLSKLVEDCFIQKEPLRRYSGRGVEAMIGHNQRTTDHGIPEQRFPIPDADLKILEKIYHNKLPECGRKRGAILRYIKFFRDQFPEPTDFFSKLKRQIERS